MTVFTEMPEVRDSVLVEVVAVTHQLPDLPEVLEAELAVVASVGRVSEVSVVAGGEIKLTLDAKLPDLGDGVGVVLVGVDGVRLPVVEAGLTELAHELL